MSKSCKATCSAKQDTISRRAKALSSSVLEAHNKETAHELLPFDLSQWKVTSQSPAISEVLPSTRSDNTSVYDENLPELLTRRQVFDEVIPPNTQKPKNSKAIKDAIAAIPPLPTDTRHEEQYLRQYSTYCQIVLDPNISESEIRSQAYNHYFDIPFKLPGIHVCGGGLKWGDVDQPDLVHVPRPDYCEGISSLLLPEWIEVRLGNYARPIPAIAFPNFIVNYKGSIRAAHIQCRLVGAYAARAYYELHRLYGNPDVILDTALVGTVEFNGEICVGNIHWVSKLSEGSGDLQYHMKRVLCCFTRGVDVQEFIQARQLAMNFRVYFSMLREEHFNKLRSLKPPDHHAEERG